MRYDEPGLTWEERLKKSPDMLDHIADAALRYRPKSKAKKMKSRKRRKAK
jgi:hypothetical protein